MSLIDNLEKYTKYSKGDLTQKCSLVVYGDYIDTLDFSPYDLNNSVFAGVTFNNCDFDFVYLSGSHFGGSIFNHCRFNNILRKANWSYISMSKTLIYNLDAFRVDFFQCRFM